MPRQPDIKNKSNRLVYIPSEPSEVKMAQDAKTLCIQDGITIRDLLSEALTLVFKVHNYPPGNPQLTLTNYQVKPLVRDKCGFAGCKCDAEAFGVYLPTNKRMGLCSLHVKHAVNSAKVWRVGLP